MSGRLAQERSHPWPSGTVTSMFQGASPWLCVTNLTPGAWTHIPPHKTLPLLGTGMYPLHYTSTKQQECLVFPALVHQH